VSQDFQNFAIAFATKRMKLKILAFAHFKKLSTMQNNH
jgi:hypothetical protein